MSESNEYNPYTAGQMVLPATQEPARYAPQAAEYNPYAAGQMRGTTSSGYPDMTPGPSEPKKSILSTSFNTVPSDTRPQGFWDTLLAPGEGNVRVGTAMREAYRDTPPIVGPAARDWINRQDRLPRAILGTAADVGDTLVKGASAVGTGITSNVSELLSGGNPQLARDITGVQQVLPATLHMTPGPRSILPGGKDVPTGGEPMWRKPVTTVDEADALYKPLIKTAEQSSFRLRPEFTQEWAKSLGQYGPQSAFEKAAQPSGTPVTQLAGALQEASKTASLDNIQSIQGIDRMIQTGIQEELKAGRIDNARQMRGMLQDFREKYTNPPGEMFTGDQSGIAAFRDSVKAYAARSRIAEVQGIVDSTEGREARANLIVSRLNAFLNNDKNTRGWSPAEIAAVRKAATPDFVAEMMRAGGSRLGAFFASYMSGVPILALPANVGTAMAIRSTAEGRRIADVNRALGILGQGVPQPGTVPPPPGPGIPPRSLMTGARYAPLVGLLGQSLANEEASR